MPGSWPRVQTFSFVSTKVLPNKKAQLNLTVYFVFSTIQGLYLHEWKRTDDSTELEEKWAVINEAKLIIESNVYRLLVLPNDIKQEE
jgi:hypothetical protein